MQRLIRRGLRTAVLLGIGLVSSFGTSRAGAADATEKGLKAGDYVAVIGDSITEQKQYSAFIECYLTLCKPAANLRQTQFGWGGETAPGFLSRMAGDMVPFKPTVTTTCYGMNDGGYSPMDDGKAKRYRDAQTEIVKQMKAAGVRFIVVGSPGCVDRDFFRKDPKDPTKAVEAAAMYNKTLSQLRDIAKEVAEKQGVAFADVFGAMIEVMDKAKGKYGTNYHVCGGDGFHPDANGHLVMAYAFLKALGCDGNIGTITVDLAASKAEATDGHKVLGVKDGAVEVESSRYPFCFYGDPKATGATAGIIEFFPFNDDLNRFKLVVKGIKGDKASVTWGKATREFTAAQLAAGINLAAEFVNDNPFSERFRQIEGEIRKKQGFETPLVKDMMHNLPKYKQIAPEESAALDRIVAAGVKKDKQMGDDIAAQVKPVKHTITIK